MNLFDHDGLKWTEYEGKPQFGHPVRYRGAVLDARPDGHVDLLYQWAPLSSCHFHRHTSAISSLILEGELTVIDIDPETGGEVGRVVKTAGTWVHKAPGDVHIEIGGPEGALVLFSLYAPDGKLVDVLSSTGQIVDEQRLEPILESRALA
jgi:hypothetical protein